MARKFDTFLSPVRKIVCDLLIGRTIFPHVRIIVSMTQCDMDEFYLGTCRSEYHSTYVYNKKVHFDVFTIPFPLVYRLPIFASFENHLHTNISLVLTQDLSKLKARGEKGQFTFITFRQRPLSFMVEKNLISN